MKRSQLDLVRLEQACYFDEENVRMIAFHEYSYALSHCKKWYRTKMVELKCLLLYFDRNDGVLRVEVKTIKSSLPTETIHQRFLSKNHFVTEFIVVHENRRCNHFEANYVISKLMQRFWVCSGVATVRKYLSNRMCSKICRAQSQTLLISDLPECRVTVPKFPFQFTGCDLLGPLYVKVSRSIVKRWGVLFICMSSRGCHLNFVPDLTTSSFIQCFWRFTCR